MANGMGSLYVGKSGLTSAQNAINTTGNNLTNVNTKGYVRQQVLFTDMNYNTLSVAKKDVTTGQSVNIKQSGLGVSIGDVVHSRDLFLDKYYRTESGRQMFYETCYATTNEIYELLQETEGEAFQDVLADLNEAIQELAKDPGSSVNQNLVVQKASLFVERSQALYSGLQEYQLNMNKQITDTVDRINDLGKQISELNEKIRRVEAGGVETAMTLRDERDLLLDELGTLANISYSEVADGVVKVKLEGVDFVDEVTCHEMTTRKDMITGFETPVWKELSNFAKEQYVNVFDFNSDISTELNTDIGKLKALVMSRGTDVADFTDIVGVTAQEFNDTTGLSSIQTVEAQVDHLVRTVVKTINDILSPTTTKSITVNGVTQEYTVWDDENGTVGADGKGPGQELFSRKSVSRYTEMVDDNGKTWYVYNAEDLGETQYDAAGNAIAKDTATFYNLLNLEVNPVLIADETKLPTFNLDGEVGYDLADKLKTVWSDANISLTPGSTMISFNDYYDNMVGAQASNGNVFLGVSNTLTSSVTSIGNQREQVIGVSSDEELSSMIKYQSAYNAASRFINTIDAMIEHIITQLGS